VGDGALAGGVSVGGGSLLALSAFR